MPRSRWISVRRPLPALIVAACAVWLWGCDSGSAGGHGGRGGMGVVSDAGQDVATGSISIGFGDAANLCPSVVLTAGPVEAPVGHSIAIQAWPSDRDATDAGTSPRLTFAWTAPGGKLSDLTTPQVDFACLVPGRYVVTVGVSDGQCTTMETIELRCSGTDAGTDRSGGGGTNSSGGGNGTRGSGGSGTSGSGGSGTSGSGGSSSSGGATGSGSGGATASGGAVGSGGSSSSTGGLSGGSGGHPGSGGASPGSGGSPGTGGRTPGKPFSEDVSEACTQCTTDNCVADAENCQIYAGNPTDRQLCEDVYECYIKERCRDANNGDPWIHCWCGTADSATCVNPPTQENGPCMKQVQAAAKSTDPATIRLRFTDPSFPVGGASNLANCRGGSCASECGLP